MLWKLGNPFSAERRAYRRLLRASRFAVGRIGPCAVLSKEEKALAVLAKNGRTDLMIELTQVGSLAGQLYGLLGLAWSSNEVAREVLAKLKAIESPVATQAGCFSIAESASNIVSKIAAGAYPSWRPLSTPRHERNRNDD